ncbi:GNAT family N-acetyltransferase [Zobellia galactanivorans]|uniref:GNAT family N-acetyltransferase n=1 Tax=Zobellia galactanivorans (strain DSM 12802 / CCUG 47099 / CIP 106680 / NCIMB 13871 / Dsij) TaxID=63186 RepID=UPI001C067068|nr:GNAT family N-acetyltransferase [Zobellia galactanivorans]MBU3024399.1 GNAT family N-acetyltransferase [Zobellia galactanivorans]MDO6807506.1 GNAT family N-acetyltransferase [Zobellia galactanivorans]
MNSTNFFFDAYTKELLPTHYRQLQNRYTGDVVFTNSNTDEFHFEGPAFVVEDVPGYFKVETEKLPKNIGRHTIKQYPGFLINFENVPSLGAYLNERFGKTSRYKLRREQRKLEQCFDIRYVMYFGAMEKPEYDFLMDEFYRLLELRSLEKGIKDNINLATQDFYRANVYQMILDKKASFYVIYNGKKPIDICLNFHMKNVIFQYIRTYDIDYSKFNTGYTDLMKQIEWCIANGVRLITFSKGDFYWKRRWCNTVYDYNYDIFFKKNSLKGRLKAQLYYLIKALKQFVREKGLIEKYHDFRDKHRKPINLPNDPSKITRTPIPFEKEFEKIEAIDFKNSKFDFLRRTIYDFLYENDEKESEINVYAILDHPKSYLVVGKKSKILLSNTSDSPIF